MRILDQSVKTLCRKEVHLVEVLWLWHGVEEAMWEHEDMMQHFSGLFLVEDGNSRY